MLSTASLITQEPLPSPPAGEGEGALRVLRARYEDLWWSTKCTVPEPWSSFDRHCRRRNLQRIQGFLRDLPGEIAACPESGPGRVQWQESFRQRLLALGEECFGWPSFYRDSLLGQPAFACSKAFARRARSELPGLANADLFQALRNLWIMNGLQLAHGLPVELTGATYAYSMLYPLTDNLLDSTDSSAGEKEAFGASLGLRLGGSPVCAASHQEEEIFHLVGLIEERFPRARFPEVYSSLLAIHRAQMASLQQHGAAAPFERNLLGLSLAKGGASVLADGYLVAGHLSQQQVDFCYGYGVFLQLLDDLQDVREDQRSGQQTLFSQTAGHWPLDRLASRVYHLMQAVLADAPYAEAQAFPMLRDLIQRNCTHLMLQAIARHRRFFSARYVRHMEAFSPIPFASIKKLRRLFERSLRQCQRAADARGGEVDFFSFLGP